MSDQPPIEIPLVNLIEDILIGSDVGSRSCRLKIANKIIAIMDDASKPQGEGAFSFTTSSTIPLKARQAAIDAMYGLLATPPTGRIEDDVDTVLKAYEGARGSVCPYQDYTWEDIAMLAQEKMLLKNSPEHNKSEISDNEPEFDADQARKDLKPAAWELLKKPVIQSLLYDINLLPEQITGRKHWFYMFSILSHMDLAMKPVSSGSPCARTQIDNIDEKQLHPVKNDDSIGSPVKYSDGSYSREYEDQAKEHSDEIADISDDDPVGDAYANGYAKGYADGYKAKAIAIERESTRQSLRDQCVPDGIAERILNDIEGQS